MRLGVVCAFDGEIRGIISAMSRISIESHAMRNFNVGVIHNVDVVAVECGICKVNAAIAAQVLIDKFSVTNIVFVGVAGAIDARLNICDTIVASEVVYHDVYESILTKNHPFIEKALFRADEKMTEGILSANPDETVLSGKIVTGESFITDEGRESIIERFDPACVDMETAAVAHVAYVNKIPFAAIRSMSDTPHESGEDNFMKYCLLAADKSVKVLLNYLVSL